NRRHIRQLLERAADSGGAEAADGAAQSPCQRDRTTCRLRKQALLYESIQEIYGHDAGRLSRKPAMQGGILMIGKKQGFNPYLPSWEYIPDGEPYVFDGRVYVYGSHDRFNGHAFCLNDYVCWSAPVDDLGDWRYEGVIYRKTDDPLNPD